MNRSLCFLGGLLAFCAPAWADNAAFVVKLEGIENGKPIPAKFAFCEPDGKGKSKDASNISPAISWEGAPEGTKSFALIVVDGDVPTDFSVANVEGKTIPDSMPRQNFYHWAVVNIPVSVTSYPENIGKSPAIKGWVGINDFASFMKDKPAQTFVGYDGPCPPWNDERLHHYKFQVYALSTGRVVVKGGFTGKDALEAIKPHVIAVAETVGTYTNKK